MAHDVFLSYAREDGPFVEKLDHALQAAGVDTWFDKRNLGPGQRWEQVIEDTIPFSLVFLTCLSVAALDKRGYFHVEQQLAVKAAMRVPSDKLFLIPVLLGDCPLPRELRQYHAVNLVEPAQIEALFRSIGEALDRPVDIEPHVFDGLRDALRAHLGKEAAPNEDYFTLFGRTDEISWQDSCGLVERIANSRDPGRLALLLRMRGMPEISYAEQAALDLAIENVRGGRPTKDLQQIISSKERARIAQMRLGDPELTSLMQINKYFRYISRKNTEPFRMAQAKLLELFRAGLLGKEEL